MRAYKYIIFFIILSNNLFGQLNITATELMNGVFVRNMKNDYIESEKTKKWFSRKLKESYINIPKPKMSYNFVRFSELKLDSSSTKETIYLGKVFMSHTYFEAKFDSLFNTKEKFANCTNGYYMLCKIFLTRGGNTKVNIYPDFNNYCIRKKPHEKVDTCANLHLYDTFSENRYEERCSNFKDHFAKLAVLMRVRDYEAEDFWSSEEEQEKNILPCEFKINFEKFIKCFQINIDQENKITGLTLDYTKYSKSTDKSEQNKYSYDYRCYESIEWIGTYNSFIGTYKSINRPKESQLDSKEAPLSYQIRNDNIYIVDVKRAPFGCINQKEHNLTSLPIDKNIRTGWIFAGHYGDFKNFDRYVLLTNAVLNNNQFQDFKKNNKPFRLIKNVFLYDIYPQELIDSKKNHWRRGKEIGIIDKNTSIILNDFKICEDKISNKLSIWLNVSF